MKKYLSVCISNGRHALRAHVTVLRGRTFFAKEHLSVGIEVMPYWQHAVCAFIQVWQNLVGIFFQQLAGESNRKKSFASVN